MKPISNERGNKCKQHDFLLRPLHQNLHHSRKVQISMCDNRSKIFKKKQQGSKRKCCTGYPILNTDKNYATPAFILESQQEHFLENRNFYLKDHSRKIKQYEQVPTDLYFPAPRSSYDYCNVCCISYSDYIQHISSFEHHRQIRMTKYNDYIIDLEETFKKSCSQENRKRTIQQRCIEIDDDSDFSMSGRKKVKTEEKTQLTENLQRISDIDMTQFKNYYQFNNYMVADPILNGHNHNNTIEKNVYNKGFSSVNTKPQNYAGFGQYCQNQYNELMYKYYYGSNTDGNLKFQQQQQQQPNNQNHYYSIESNYQIGSSNYHQQNQLNHCFMENGLKYLPFQQYYQHSMPFFQFPLLCFNNFNQNVFTW